MRYARTCFVVLLLAAGALAQQTPPPVLFFTDLTSGPATGNSDSTYTSGGGVYVTLYGNFLGSSPTVTLNGASCLTIVSQPSSWLWYQRMVVQLTKTCTSGNFVVTNPAGASNGLPFTVNSGTIYYVSTSGNDGNSGTFQSPWKTMPHAVQTAGLKPGGIVYVESNVQQLVSDGQWKSAVTIRAGWAKGTAAQPNALIGYPGATGIQLGPTNSTATNGFGTSDFTAGDGAPAGFWTIAELVMTGASGINLAGGDTWRVIGNDVSCPAITTSGGGGSCLGTSLSTHIKTFGNNFHDMGPNSTDRLLQGVYYSTDSNHVEHAWNSQSNSGGRASFQTHSSPVSSGNGYILYDIQVHDNTIHDSREECILIDTVNPGQGEIQVYNNVVWNCAKDGSSADSLHHQLSGDFDTSHGAGSSPPPVRWYNNTVLVNNGGSCWGSSYPDIHSGFSTTNFLLNNVCRVTGSGLYFHPNAYSGATCSNSDGTTQCQSMTGQVDLVYGTGSPTYPNLMTSQVNADPLLTNTSVSGCPGACATDLHLSSGSSPANGAGSTAFSPINLVYDHDGLVRPSPPSIGAYEFSAGTITKPNPPTGLQATVQ